MRRGLYIALMWILPAITVAQPIFIAEASRYKVGLSDEFRVTFTLNATGRNFRPPSGWEHNFYIVAGPSQQTSHQIINGQASSSYELSYKIRARRTGKLTIPPASIETQGERVQTKPLEIEVVPDSDIQRDPNDPLVRARKLAYVRTLTSRRSVYPGQPFVIQYKLFTRVDPGRIEMLSDPSWPDFLRENIDLRFQYQRENVDGVPMNTGIIQAYVLIPQRPGTFSQPPAEVKIPTPVPTGGRDFWGRPLAEMVNNISHMEIPTITVKPFPEAGKPEDFNGAVGNYTFDVSLSRNELGTNESATLKISLNGSGNLQLVDLPEPALPAEIEMYEPKRKENISAGMNGIRGSITEEYVLVPRFRGTYKIPAMKFHYFNPDNGTYITLTSEPLELTVTGGSDPDQISVPLSGDDNRNRPEGSGKRSVEYHEEEIRWIHPVRADASDNIPFWSAWWFILGCIVAGLASVFALIAPRAMRWAAVRNSSGDRLRRKALIALARQRNKADDWAGLERVLTHYLSRRFGLRPMDLTRERLPALLIGAGVEKDDAQLIYRLLDECATARYASGLTRSYAEVTEDIYQWIQTRSI